MQKREIKNNNLPFNIGDIVEAFPKWELTNKQNAVITDISITKTRSEYTLTFVHEGKQAWFSPEELNLIHKCPININHR